MGEEGLGKQAKRRWGRGPEMEVEGGGALGGVGGGAGRVRVFGICQPKGAV